MSILHWILISGVTMKSAEMPILAPIIHLPGFFFLQRVLMPLAALMSVISVFIAGFD